MIQLLLQLFIELDFRTLIFVFGRLLVLNLRARLVVRVPVVASRRVRVSASHVLRGTYIQLSQRLDDIRVLVAALSQGCQVLLRLLRQLGSFDHVQPHGRVWELQAEGRRPAKLCLDAQ